MFIHIAALPTIEPGEAGSGRMPCQTLFGDCGTPIVVYPVRHSGAAHRPQGPTRANAGIGRLFTAVRIGVAGRHSLSSPIAGLVETGDVGRPCSRCKKPSPDGL